MKKYCRICFKHSADNKDTMLPLSSFIPLIKLIAKTELLQTGESSICQSCANILVVANLFRIKIIESNAVFRELIQLEDIVEWKFSDGCEFENFTSHPVIVNENVTRHPVIVKEDVYEDYEFVNDHDESYTENSNVVKDDSQPTKSFKTEVKQEQLGRVRITRSPPLLQKSPIVDARLEKISKAPAQERQQKVKKVPEHPILTVKTKKCGLCGKNEQKERPDPIILEKLFAISTTEDILVCSDCWKNLTRVETFVKNNFTVKDCKANMCQFCLNSEIQLREMPKYLFRMYNSFDSTVKKMPENVKKDKKTCNECLKALQLISDIQGAYHKKRRQDKREKYQQKRGDILQNRNIPYKKLKPRINQRFQPPASDDELPDDFQCHLSDFEEVDSDTELPPVQFGSALNIPFTPNYLECTECHTRCINSVELEVHVEVMHRTFNNICNICDKKFPNVQGAKNHKDNVHFMSIFSVNGRNGRKKLCDVCGLLIKEFNAHYETHSGAKGNYVCHLCGHATRVKARLKLHILAVHTKIRRFKCKFCGKGFSYSQDKVRHEIGSHTKKYKYICGICDRGFTKKNFMTAHQKTHDIISAKEELPLKN